MRVQPAKISRSITKSVDLCVSPELAFEFLNNLENWPKWAIVNMKSAKPAADGWYDTETRQGKGQLKMLSSKPHGVLTTFGEIHRRPGRSRRGLSQTGIALRSSSLFFSRRFWTMPLLIPRRRK